MKRIEFIAPVESMRGNLSGNQDLTYAENDNKAYYAPLGKQYARNYQPRFIGAKRASDNLKYFTVRTKSAVNITLQSLKRMACMGAAGLMVALVLRDKNAIPYQRLLEVWEHLDPSNRVSFRKMLFSVFYTGVERKLDIIIFPGQVYFLNPFSTRQNVPENTMTLEIGNDAIFKFAKQLVNLDGIDKLVQFIAGGYKMTVFQSEGAGLPTSQGVEWNDGVTLDMDLIKLNGYYLQHRVDGQLEMIGYLQKDGKYILKDDLKDGETYELTTTAPA